jgi:hypothetical protein
MPPRAAQPLRLTCACGHQDHGKGRRRSHLSMLPHRVSDEKDMVHLIRGAIRHREVGLRKDELPGDMEVGHACTKLASRTGSAEIGSNRRTPHH